MESNNNGSNLDFGFAFNDINFSDRVLRIEIEHGDETIISSTRIFLANWIRGLKEKRKNKKKGKLPSNIEVKSVQISSPILAAKSPFFFKLFSNGMKESEEQHVTLRIDPLEEVALMDLLNFMYTNTLSSSTTSSLIDVLMLADKFQVSSCIRHCIKLLCELPMTCESAFQFLHLPPSVTMADEVKPLTDAANKYLANSYEDFTKLKEELIKLPLAVIETILSSDDLQVDSEDAVYEFVLRWARKHYPVIKERRDILTTRLCSLIRFENMTCRKLKEIPSCNDFDHAYASKVVLEAFIFKAESTHLHTFRASRRYKFRPIKALEFMSPRPHCIVYLNLSKEECGNLLSSQQMISETFRLGEKSFYLMAKHCDSDSFGLFLYMCAKQSGSFFVDCEFSARSKSTEKFVSKSKWTKEFSAGKGFGLTNLFGLSWNQFITRNSIFFINEVLHLEIKIAMKS